MTIYEIIESVAAVGSTKTKEEIIQKNADNLVLRQCFYMTENGNLSFYTKFQKEWITDSPAGKRDLTVTDVVSLMNLHNRLITGHAAHAFIKDRMIGMTQEAKIIFGRIINRDLRCGAGTSIANKVWKDLIPEYPCFLAGKYDEKGKAFLKKHEGKKAFIVQNKCDGGRININVDEEGEVAVKSRAGNTLNLFGRFDNFSNYPGQVCDGEILVVKEDGTFEDRKTSNGFFTKAVRGTLTEAESKRLCVVLWDIIPQTEFCAGQGTVPYVDRLQKVREIVKSFGVNYIKVVETETADTLEEVEDFYARMRAQGEEGAIVKVAKSFWENNRSKYMVKMKAVLDADLYCYDVEMGKGKYEGMIGALKCKTRCDGLKVNIGTGLTDDDRAKDPKEYIDHIIEMTYNEIITQKGRAEKCMFLPVYKQVRYDKKQANALSELKLR
jgi:hypothetical protein